jgi:hypothetical protein
MSAARLAVFVLCGVQMLAGAVARASPSEDRPATLSADELSESSPQPSAVPAAPKARKKKRKPKPPAAQAPVVPAPPAPPVSATVPVDAEPAEAPAPAVAATRTEGTPLASRTPSSAPSDSPVARVAGVAVAAGIAGAAGPATPAEAAAASPVAPSTAAVAGTPLPAAVKIGGGAMLWYYQPIGIDGAGDNIELYDARLTLEADWNELGFYLEPHFRDSRLRSYYDGPVWLQQGYAFLDLDTTVVKVGKIYSRFGLFWDNSFYGSIQAYDGLKLAPEYGASVEGTLGQRTSDIGMRYWAQFFPIDGRTNVSLTGRDTISVPDAHRRNEAVLRVEPFARLAEGADLAVALSAEYFRADFASDPQDVMRLAVDAKLTVGGLGLWGELARQEGRSVTDFPFASEPATATTPAIAGRASAHNDYLMAGGEYTYRNVTARCNMSFGNYGDVSVLEWLVVPGLGYTIADHMTLLTEFALWQRSTAGVSTLVDRSVNVSLSAWF